MTPKKEEIEALAKQYKELAKKGDVKNLAKILPSPEQMAQFAEMMFANPEVLRRFEQEVLNKEQE